MSSWFDWAETEMVRAAMTALVVAVASGAAVLGGTANGPDSAARSGGRVAGSSMLGAGGGVEALPGENCSVTIRWQTSVARMGFSGSKVRVRGLPWVELGNAWGIALNVPAGSGQPYTNDPGNTLYYLNVELNQDCDRYRRYRFRIHGLEGTRFDGMSRDLYYPRENGFTTETNIDLGYLDLCMADGHRCDEPYHPGGNPTPYPPTERATDSRARPLEPAGEEDSPGTDLDSRNPLIVHGADLAGEWVRDDSNNDRNDGMRITVSDEGAVLTVVPSTSTRYWSVGQVIWRDVSSDGSLSVRGSDGTYYASRLALDGPDRVNLDISSNGPGNDQSWVRAGPSIHGPWVRITPDGGENDGLQVRVEGAEASIRYLPASAARGLRTGGRLWRNISPSGALEVLGSDGSYHPATATLVGADRLRIEGPVASLVGEQIWVRPDAVDGARLAGPVDDPSTPGTGLQPLGDLPELYAPPSQPPPEATTGACLATSLPHDLPSVDWRWGLTSPTNDGAAAEELGVGELMISDFAGPRANMNVVTDLERLRLPGFAEGFAFIWQPRSSRRFQTTEARDLTASGLEQRHQSARTSDLRPSDVEAYTVGTGTRYAGVWVDNTEGIGWWARHDMTGEEYGEAFGNLRRSGYRLIDMEVYDTGSGLRYAAVWYQSCDNDNWRQLRGMDRDDYQMEVDDRAQQGFRVIDFESYPTSAGPRYAAIWQRIPAGRAWRVRSDRTLKGFLNDHNQYVDEGLRLLDLESYDTPEGLRYAGIWAENGARYDAAYREVVDTMIQNYRTTHGLPGISVVAMLGDSVVYRRGFGWADSAQAKRAHSGTVYLTASVSKVVGGTIAARLEERGEIDLTAPTSDYIEDLPDHHTHTLEQLLAKVGCVPHYAEATPTRPDTTRIYAFRIDALRQMWADTLLSQPTCTPGRHYRYSTHGYTYVGAALEAVTGKPIADIIADELTLPFGLPSMSLMRTDRWGGWSDLGVRPYDLAQGYAWTGTASVTREYENSTWKVLGGGLQTNARDLARFGALTVSGAIVADTARLWAPQTAGGTSWVASVSSIRPTGLAWVVSDQRPTIVVGGITRGRRAAEHGGDGRGSGTLIRLYREGGLVIAIMANQQQSATLVNAAGNPTGHPVEQLATAIATAIIPP